MASFIVDKEPWTGGRVSDRVTCVRAHNPSPMTYVGTNSWIVSEPGSFQCIVIDPSPAGGQTTRIMEACAEEGLHISAIVVTHDHHDHTEGAKELSALTGAPLFAPKKEIGADSCEGAFFADRVLREGAFCPFDGSPVLEVFALPGHSSDSIGLLLPSEKSLFVGDVVFRHGPTVVFHPDGHLGDYLRSLDVIEGLVQEGRVVRLYPGHGYPIDDPLRALHATREHRIERLDQVKKALAEGVPAESNALFDAVYVGVDERLRWASLRSIEAQLVFLRQEER